MGGVFHRRDDRNPYKRRVANRVEHHPVRRLSRSRHRCFRVDINALIKIDYECNNRIILLSLLRRSDGDLFPSDKYDSFRQQRNRIAARHRESENQRSARRLFRVRLRLAPSVGTPAQGQRPDAAVQTQIIESRILTL